MRSLGAPAPGFPCVHRTMPTTPAAHPLPAAVQLPCVGLLIDTFLVWLGTRNAFLSWALMGCRPPLYVAAPLQLAALARIHTADFCSVQVGRGGAAAVGQSGVQARVRTATPSSVGAGAVRAAPTWVVLLLPPHVRRPCSTPSFSGASTWLTFCWRCWAAPAQARPSRP